MYSQWISNIMSKIDQSHTTETKPKIDQSTSDLSLSLETRLAASAYRGNQTKMKTNDPFSLKDDQQEKLNNNQTVDRDLLQKGITIMQLAVIEPQENTSMALYTIALNKFISAQQGVDTLGHKSHHPSWSSLLSIQQQTPFPINKQHQTFNEKTIWSQLLSVLLELSTLIMMIIHKTPLPGVISTILLLCYRQLVFLETKYQIINFACKQIGLFLYWIIDLCQHYDMPRYVAQVVYIIAMAIVHTGKTCLETKQ